MVRPETYPAKLTPPANVEVAVLESMSAPVSVPPESERYFPERSGIEALSIVELEMMTPESWSIALAAAMVLGAPPPSGGDASALNVCAALLESSCATEALSADMPALN